MKTAQILATWKLVTNNSALLKGLLATAVVCLLIASCLDRGVVKNVLGGWSILMLVFANILLITNAARLTERQQIQIIPQFRKSLLLMFASWLLISLVYVFILLHVSQSADRADPQYWIGAAKITIVLPLMILAVTLIFDRLSAALLLIGFVLMFPALDQLMKLGLPEWVGHLFIFIVKKIPILSLIALMYWLLSSSKHQKIQFSVARRWVNNATTLSFGKQVHDAEALHLLRRNQSYYLFAICWFLTLIGLILFGEHISESNPTERAGKLILVELFLLFSIPDSSIFHLRNLWLKGVGDRDSLFKIWNTKKNSAALIINISLIIINVIVAWWHSFSPQIAALIIGSVCILSFCNQYAKALAAAHYWNPTTVGICVMLANALVISSLFFFSDTIEFVTLTIVALIIIMMTLVFKAKLKSQVSQIDWLLMPKPRKF